jgi:hypothetical protein
MFLLCGTNWDPISQKTAFFIVTAVETLKSYMYLFQSSNDRNRTKSNYCGSLFLRDPTEYMSSSLHPKTETDPVSETLCFLVFRNPCDGQTPEPQ